MFFAAVETDIGDVLNLLRPDNTIGGNGLLAFISGFELLCQKSDDTALIQWFGKLEAQLNGSICELARPLIHAYYSGNWNYQQQQYEVFRLREQIPLTDEQFRRTIDLVAEKWTDIRLLLDLVNELNNSLRQAQLESAWWYTPGYTDTDLEALAQTLELAIERGARKVRIRIT